MVNYEDFKNFKGIKGYKALMMVGAAVTFFTTCDNNELPEAATQSEPLQILVGGQDFTSGEPQLRASVGDNYWINFANGDQIGIFTLASDGTTILDNNVPYCYQSGTWQPAGVVQAYRRTGASYVTYFPYNSANNGRTMTQIVAAFTPLLSA